MIFIKKLHFFVFSLLKIIYVYKEISTKYYIKRDMHLFTTINNYKLDFIQKNVNT